MGRVERVSGVADCLKQKDAGAINNTLAYLMLPLCNQTHFSPSLADSGSPLAAEAAGNSNDDDEPQRTWGVLVTVRKLICLTYL